MEAHSGNTPHRQQAGVTLIELIVALAVVVTLACVAAPAFSQLRSRSRLQTAQTDLFAALNHARGVAVTNGRRTMLCPSRDGRQCNDGLHWEDGWLLGHYYAGQANQIDGAPLRSFKGDPQLTILSTAGRQRVRFQADGTAGASNVIFTLCARGKAEGTLTVVASNAGRVYGSKATVEQGRRCAAGG